MSATQINATSIQTTSLNGTPQAGRHRVHVMADGYRTAIWTDGTNLLFSASVTGESAWGTPGTQLIAGVTALDKTIASVMTDKGILVLRISGTSILYNFLPYNGAGSFGAVTSGTAISGLAATPSGIRIAYDGLGTTTDAGHTANTTGIVHVLLDSGTSMTLYALDPNNSTAWKVVCTSPVITTRLSAPTYNTDLLVRVPGAAAKLYILSVGGAGAGWVAWEVAYQSGSFTTTTVQNQSNTFSFTGGAGTVWADHASGLPDGNYWWTPASHPAWPGSTSYYRSQPASGWTIPTGTWTANAAANATGVSCTQMIMTLFIYELTSAGQYILRGQLNGTLVSGALSSSQSFTATGILSGWTMAAGSSLVWSLMMSVTGVSLPTGTSITFQSDQLLVPTPTAAVSSTTTQNTYTVGTIEGPGLPVAAIEGASCVLSDSTSNPGIDIFVNTDAGAIQTMNRDKNGTYSVVTTIATSPVPVPGVSPAAIRDPATGNEAVLYPSTGGHISAVKRASGGAWGAAAQWDTAASATIQTGMAAVSRDAYGIAGAAAAYMNQPTPNTLWFEDQNFSGSAIAPTGSSCTPTNTGTSNPNVFGWTSPFYVTTLTPSFLLTYLNSGNSGDRMAALDVTVTDTTASSTAWHSGMTALSPTLAPLPGGTYQFAYGSFGAAATALVAGHHYTITVSVKESMGGNTASTASVQFNVQTTPTVTAISPTTVTSTSTTFTATYTQAEGLTCSLMEVSISAADGSGIDSGAVAITAVASGGTLTYAANLAGHLSPGKTYTLSWIANAGGFWGTGTATLTISIPTPPPPTGVTATFHRSTNPFDGSQTEIDWTQPAAGGGQSAPVSNRVYRQVNGVTTLVGTSTALHIGSGTNARSVWSDLCGQTYTYGVSSVDSNGFESATVWATPVFLQFRLGIHLNEAANPANRLEIGLIDMTASDRNILWHDQSSSTYVTFWDRSAGLDVPGGTYYVYSDDFTTKLEATYELATEAQLKTWAQNRTLLQVRDGKGHLYFCTLTKRDLVPGQSGFARLSKATVAFREDWRGQSYGLLTS